MRYYAVRENPHFVGREFYWRQLQEIDRLDEASVIVVYGRRRVGKTELLEQFFRKKPILKFEGLQPDRRRIRRNSPHEKRRQMAECLARLDEYAQSRGPHYSNMNVRRWSDFFRLLLPFVEQNEVILYFEELQWLANYRDEFLSEFKPFWDDTLRHNRKLRVIVSGSAPAFIVNQFISTSAMYGRSNHMLKLEPFDLREIDEFLRKGKRETLLAAIAVGGIPEYLKQLKNAPSVYTGLCGKSFVPEAFFRREKDRIFVSSLSTDRAYEDILDYLAQRGHAAREEIYRAIDAGHRKKAGGSFSTALDHLVEVDFVEQYAPLTVADPEHARNVRYAIADEYLQLYYRLIRKKARAIDAGKFIANPADALPLADFNKLMGYAFERWCRKNEALIAGHLQFAGVVDYDHGSWFERGSGKNAGLQIDLMFIRKDSRIILCEIKYNVGKALTAETAYETGEKLERFIGRNPKYRNYTLETALITMEPVTGKLAKDGYFRYLITAEDLLGVAGRGEGRG